MSPALPSSSGAYMPPFHLAIAVHDLPLATSFYKDALGCTDGASSKHWQMLNMYGHQLVLHDAGPTYRALELVNEHDDVPMPHFGVCLTVHVFHALCDRVASYDKGMHIVHQPHVRYAGTAGEQWKIFFRDPSGNNLELKAYVNPDAMFATYSET
ncbi:hypothetical protein SPRG_16422, partial [Saprolegnia parasitica CBS 223.65]